MTLQLCIHTACRYLAFLLAQTFLITKRANTPTILRALVGPAVSIRDRELLGRRHLFRLGRVAGRVDRQAGCCSQAQCPPSLDPFPFPDESTLAYDLLTMSRYPHYFPSLSTFLYFARVLTTTK